MKNNPLLIAAVLFLAGSPALGAADTLQIESLSVSGDTVILSFDRPASYRSESSQDPPRLIITIDNAALPFAQTTRAAEGSWLSEVRASQAQDGSLSARIELDLIEATSYEITAMENTLTIHVGGTPANIAAVTPEEPSPTVHPAALLLAGMPQNALWAMLLALACLSLYIPLKRHGRSGPSRYTEAGAILGDAQLKIDTMVDHVTLLSSRLAVMERKLSNYKGIQPCSGGHASNGKMEDEIKNLKSLVKVVIKTLQSPLQI